MEKSDCADFVPPVVLQYSLYMTIISGCYLHDTSFPMQHMVSDHTPLSYNTPLYYAPIFLVSVPQPVALQLLQNYHSHHTPLYYVLTKHEGSCG